MGNQTLSRAGILTVTAPLRWLIVTAAVFFIAAGRLHITRAWVYFGCYFIGFLISSYVFIRKVPGLANERGKIKEGTKKWDAVIVPLYFFLGIIVTPLVAGLDARFDFSPLPFGFLYLGIAIYIASLVMSMWPILHNPFFEGTVRIQTDRNQTVIDSGPYAIIRHPGYVGMILVSLTLPFALGSLVSLIPAGVMIILVVIRTHLEDNTLKRELPGYEEYANRVKYRLIPYIW